MQPITERSATELARSIRDRELSAAEVVAAHIELHQAWAPAINALAADRFEAAMKEARAADDLIGTGAELPPLLGVPFTVKESISLQGMPNAAGVVARRDYRAAGTAPAAQRLIDAGAIPLGVTNTSELTLWIESTNRLYGRTSTPYDRGRTAGGSSGGEGAAVGCGGSPFGLASDIAGSIRIPAFFCGVFGHKPSAGAVPNTGSFPPTAGESGRMLQSGPIARRAEDLMPLLRILAGPDGTDRYAREIVLNDPATVSIAGLDVALLEDTSARDLSRELRDAREQAAGALRALGATVRRVSLGSWKRALGPYVAALATGSTGPSTSELLLQSGEPPIRKRDLLKPGGPHTVSTRIALAGEATRRAPPGRSRMLSSADSLVDELVGTVGEGVLLHPVHPRVAPRHGRTVGRPWLLVPAAMFNLAGLPVTEVPLGLENGLPLGVQVAAGPDSDHVAIAVAMTLERIFGGWVPPTLPERRRRMPFSRR